MQPPMMQLPSSDVAPHHNCRPVGTGEFVIARPVAIGVDAVPFVFCRIGVERSVVFSGPKAVVVELRHPAAGQFRRHGPACMLWLWRPSTNIWTLMLPESSPAVVNWAINTRSSAPATAFASPSSVNTDPPWGHLHKVPPLLKEARAMSKPIAPASEP